MIFFVYFNLKIIKIFIGLYSIIFYIKLNNNIAYIFINNKKNINNKKIKRWLYWDKILINFKIRKFFFDQLD